MMKAFFLVIFLLNEDHTHTQYHIGRLPGCAYANNIVDTWLQKNKINDDIYAGYLCMSSKHYWDEDVPKYKEKPNKKVE